MTGLMKVSEEHAPVPLRHGNFLEPGARWFESYKKEPGAKAQLAQSEAREEARRTTRQQEMAADPYRAALSGWSAHESANPRLGRPLHPDYFDMFPELWRSLRENQPPTWGDAQTSVNFHMMARAVYEARRPPHVSLNKAIEAQRDVWAALQTLRKDPTQYARMFPEYYDPGKEAQRGYWRGSAPVSPEQFGERQGEGP
jgi:hypothetical protein